MKIVRHIEEMQALSRSWRQAGESIGFVPTMGYLHEGHLSLVDVAASRASRMVVSIYVNPKQFGPTEDFERYPRDEAGDADKLGTRKVDAVFAPTDAEMYPKGFETIVECTKLSAHLCGLRREGHFKGVTTVVLKLFNAVLPDVAVFGEKDYQQLLVIQRMARDLNLPIEIVGAPTIRTPDGLAMSSRNSYLSPEDRKAATVLYRALTRAKQLVTSGMVDAVMVRQAMTEMIEQTGGRIDYVAIVDPDTLDECQTIQARAHAAVAVCFGKTRLIDNMRLKG